MNDVLRERHLRGERRVSRSGGQRRAFRRHRGGGGDLLDEYIESGQSEAMLAMPGACRTGRVRCLPAPRREARPNRVPATDRTGR